MYATNKESDIEDKVNEIQSRAKILHDMLEKKNEILETRKDRALHVAKQLSSKEKVLLIYFLNIYLYFKLYHILFNYIIFFFFFLVHCRNSKITI